MRIALPVAVVAAFLSSFAPDVHAQGLVLSGTDRPDRATRALPVVRLGEHRVEVVVDGRVAHVQVRQRFENTTGTEREGTYLFPLPPDASVGDFSMSMGGRMVKGEVLAADEARAIYRDIVRRRRDPGLLEYVGRGLFRASVFPIPARGSVTIELRYDQVLAADGGVVEFAYPLGTDRLHPGPVGVVLVDVTVRGGARLSSIHCPSHRATVRRDDAGDAHVVHEGGGTAVRDDFVLWLAARAGDTTLRVVSHKPAHGTGTFLALLAPPRDPRTVVEKDVVYVVDTSGSMEGRKLAQAKEALRYGIGQLRPGDRFGVLAFSTDTRAFATALVPADEEHRARATDWVAALPAAGGTALAAALTEAVALGDPKRLFLVVLITDGRPTVGERRPQAILDGLARANRGRARVFTFGVGGDLNVPLLDRIAEATGGARDYVGEHERIDAGTARLFRRIDRPVMADVSLEFGPGIEQVYPRAVGDLFAGDDLVLLGRYREAGERTITLRGRRGDETVEMRTTVALTDAPRAAFLPRLWAQRKVAYLLDALRLAGPGADGRDELVDEVVRLGKRFGIVTPYTAGLVLEDEAPRRGSPGRGGSFRGPSGGVPPGVREPSDPSPAPVGPTTPGTPPPAPSDPGSHGRPRKGISSSTPLHFDSGTRRSEELRDDKERASVDSVGTVRDAGGRTFRLDDDRRWVDTAWDGEAGPERIEAFSERYWSLLDEHERLHAVLSLGERVLFLLDGRPVEIVPPAPEEPEEPEED